MGLLQVRRRNSLKIAPALFIITICFSALAQEPLRFYSETGVGPLAVWSDIYQDQTGWTAGIKNESPDTIKSFCLCIRPARDKDGCRVLTKCYTQHLKPGEVFRVSEPITARGHGLPLHRIVLLSMSHVTPLDSIRKLYVDEMAGGIAGFGRDQVKASIVANSNGRFELIEDRSKADGVITGRAEARDTGQFYSSDTKSAGYAIVAAPLAVGIAAGSKSWAESGRTEVVTRNSLILRLVSGTGQTVWAWDDSKPCPESEPRAKCAIIDLLTDTKQ